MRRGERRGCLPPIFLVGLGIGLGILGGLVLPYSLRLWATARLPARWTALAQPPPTPTPTPTPKPTPPPTPTPTPLPTQLVIPQKTREVARLYNGVQVRSSLEGEPGKQAALEREIAPDYALDLQLQIKVPTAARTPEELSRSAPTLLATFPKLAALLDKAEVSRFYFGLYQNKTESLRQNLAHLDNLLPRDVFYDTDTILELQDPDSKRRVLLIQSDMDVDSDGSDPDRLADLTDAADPTFQPLTSYKWPKKGVVPNPLLKPYRDRLDRLEADAKVNPAARRATQGTMETLRSDLYQMEHYDSLVARTDPYIVLPGFMVRQAGHPYQPKLGDYALVLAGDQLYPAIFGDIGPSNQLGEASLRLAQAVDPRATPARSPVNDLKITYLVFPGSADNPPGPPDLGKLRQRCQALLNEIGGSPVELHDWPDLLAPPLAPTQTPTPVSSTPSPTPTGTPSAAPAAPPSSPATTPVPTASATVSSGAANAKPAPPKAR